MHSSFIVFSAITAFQQTQTRWLTASNFLILFFSKKQRKQNEPFFCRFAVFGGAAIQMENQAQLLWKAGVELYNDPSYFQAGQGSNTAALFSGAYLDSPAPPGKTGTYKIEKIEI